MLYLAGVELGHLLSFQIDVHEYFGAFWPPAGLLLAVLAASHYRRWPPLLLAAATTQVAADVLLHAQSAAVSIGFCVANSLDACLGAALLRRLVGLPPSMGRIKDVVALAGCVALFVPMTGALAGAGIIVAADAEAAFWPAWRMWWVSHAVGVLVIAPVFFTWTTGAAALRKGTSPWRIAEAAALFLGLAVMTACLYGDLLPRVVRAPIVILPFLLWACLRFGPRGAASALGMVALIGVWNIARGRGPFAVESAPWAEQLQRAQGTLAMICLCVLLLAAIVAERQRAEAARIALVAELQTALSEIKTLSGFIPICAWCNKVRDDGDFWRSVEDYLAQHTPARFSHAVCPECLARAMTGLKNKEPSA